MIARWTLWQLRCFLFGGRFCFGQRIFDLFQDGVVLLRPGLGQALKEDVRGFRIAAKDLMSDAGAEFIRKVYALGKQGCPPDGTGADVVFPCDAFTGFLGGPLVFILNTAGWCRGRMLVAVKSIMLFCVVLLPNEELFLFWGQIASPQLVLADPDRSRREPAPGSLKSKDKR